VPDNWESGIYIAYIHANSDMGTIRLTSDDLRGDAEPWYIDFLNINEIVFVVKDKNPGTHSKILYCTMSNTIQVYNSWGGGSWYNGGLTTVSFLRPFGGFSHYGQSIHNFDVVFASWAESEGYKLDYCTEYDLHKDPNANWIKNYNLLIWNSHLEYCTQEEWQCIETFQRTYGGHFCIFAGNTSTHYCSYDASGTKFTKGNMFSTSDQKSKLGLYWGFNIMLWKAPDVDPYAAGCGYTVSHLANHWIYTGTGVQPGTVFGSASRAVSWEVDFCDYSYNGATHAMTPVNMPAGMQILAANRYTGYGRYHYQEAKTAIVIFPKGTNGGLLFNSGANNWTYGLWIPEWEKVKYSGFNTDPVIQQITRNLLDSLGNGSLQLVENKKISISGPALSIFPNPFKGTIAISCQLSVISKKTVPIEIYSMNGKMVKKLRADSRQLRAGIKWHAGNIPSGFYIIRSLIEGKNLQKTVVFIK
jgi:hypothetical protein